MSDLLYLIFLFPVRLAELHVGSCLIGGALGQALGKLRVFLADVSSLVSIQSLILITVNRFWAVVVPLPSSLISLKRCKLSISVTWIGYSDGMAISVCFQSCWKPRRNDVPASVEGGLWSEKLICYFPHIRGYNGVSLHPCRSFVCSLLHHPDQA